MSIVCIKCGTDKPFCEYSKHRKAKTGRQSTCKLCAKQIRKEWSFSNHERQKITLAKNYLLNKDIRDADNKRWVSENIERRREIARNSNRKYPERLRLSGLRWRTSNIQLIRYRYSQRRSLKLQRTPLWSNSGEILEFYITAEGLGMITGVHYEVDHIVPLQSHLVCGLHCEANLQVLQRSENRSKSNRYWPDMPV